MREAIFVAGLTKKYGEKSIVNHLNLSVKSGTVFGLLGANGAGKSTMIECILGTKKADGGIVQLFGKIQKSNVARCLNALAYSFKRVIIRRRSRFLNFVKKWQVFTADQQIGVRFVSSSA